MCVLVCVSRVLLSVLGTNEAFYQDRESNKTQDSFHETIFSLSVLLWNENMNDRSKSKAERESESFLKTNISSALFFRLKASEVMKSCGRWKLPEEEKRDTADDVWTADAVSQFALAPFLFCFKPHLLFLKHFMRLYMFKLNLMFCSHVFRWNIFIHDYHTNKEKHVSQLLCWQFGPQTLGWSIPELINVFTGTELWTVWQRPPVDKSCIWLRTANGQPPEDAAELSVNVKVLRKKRFKKVFKVSNSEKKHISVLDAFGDVKEPHCS